MKMNNSLKSITTIVFCSTLLLGCNQSPPASDPVSHDSLSTDSISLSNGVATAKTTLRNTVKQSQNPDNITPSQTITLNYDSNESAPDLNALTQEGQAIGIAFSPSNTSCSANETHEGMHCEKITISYTPTTLSTQPVEHTFALNNAFLDVSASIPGRLFYPNKTQYVDSLKPIIQLTTIDPDTGVRFNPSITQLTPDDISYPYLPGVLLVTYQPDGSAQVYITSGRKPLHLGPYSNSELRFKSNQEQIYIAPRNNQQPALELTRSFLLSTNKGNLFRQDVMGQHDATDIKMNDSSLSAALSHGFDDINITSINLRRGVPLPWINPGSDFEDLQVTASTPNKTHTWFVDFSNFGDSSTTDILMNNEFILGSNILPLDTQSDYLKHAVLSNLSLYSVDTQASGEQPEHSKLNLHGGENFKPLKDYQVAASVGQNQALGYLDPLHFLIYSDGSFYQVSEDSRQFKKLDDSQQSTSAISYTEHAADTVSTSYITEQNNQPQFLISRQNKSGNLLYWNPIDASAHHITATNKIEGIKLTHFACGERPYSGVDDSYGPATCYFIAKNKTNGHLSAYKITGFNPFSQKDFTITPEPLSFNGSEPQMQLGDKALVDGDTGSIIIYHKNTAKLYPLGVGQQQYAPAIDVQATLEGSNEKINGLFYG